MKKFTFILTSMLFLLVGGVFSQSVTTLYLDRGGSVELSNKVYTDSHVTGATVKFNENRFNGKYFGLTGSNWVADLNAGETHTFKITLNSGAPAGFHFYIASNRYSDFSHANARKYVNATIPEGETSVSYSIDANTYPDLLKPEGDNVGPYKYVYIVNEGTQGAKLDIASITRTVTSGGGGGGSALEGKTAVPYNILGKDVIFSDSFDSNIGNWAIWNGNEYNGSVNWDNTTGHNSNGCMKVVNNESRPSEPYKIQRHASLSTISSGTKFFVTFYIKCESGTGSIRCSTTGKAQYQGDQNVTTEWQKIVWEVTAEGNIDGLCLDMAHTANTYYIDDVEVYNNAANGDSEVFTSDEQVANIASSAFSGLTAGNYICADVEGTPETIKLVCNDKDYNLTKFNGSTLWGIKATADMVTALQNNNSQFKGHDLTLNGISIYKTKTISESSSDNGITLVNNTFVEQNRPFAANKWNTVCLPYKPTAAQATLLFGTGYQISEFTGVSGTTLEFTNLASIDDFVAGRPYLLMPGTGFATAETSPVVLEDVNITAATPETVTYTIDEKDYSFSGTFNTKSFAGTEWSTTRFVSNNLLMTPNSTDAMKGLRCYFTLPAADGARSFSLGFDEEGNTTGVADINRETIANNGDFFNLAGQRVAQPTKGLYIVNGKKVVIK